MTGIGLAQGVLKMTSGGQALDWRWDVFWRNSAVERMYRKAGESSGSADKYGRMRW